MGDWEAPGRRRYCGVAARRGRTEASVGRAGPTASDHKTRMPVPTEDYNAGGITFWGHGGWVDTALRQYGLRIAQRPTQRPISWKAPLAFVGKHRDQHTSGKCKLAGSRPSAARLTSDQAVMRLGHIDSTSPRGPWRGRVITPPAKGAPRSYGTRRRAPLSTCEM